MTSASTSFLSRLMPFRFLLLAVAAAFLLWNLNYAPVWNPDEGRYVSASLEMLAPLDGSTPDWVVPHLNTLPRLNKPPLVYWCAATLFKVFGPSVATARLVPALAAIGVLLILWRLGAAMFGEKTGILATLIWTFSFLPFILARLLSTDMLLAVSTSLAMLGIYQIVSRRNRASWALGSTLIAGIGLALAILAKGPVGILLPLSILVAWSTLAHFKTPAFLKTPRSGGRTFAMISAAIILAGVLTAPWYLSVGRAHPEFLQKFLLGENVARFTGSTFYHDKKPFLFYVPIIIVGLLPWTAFLWPSLRLFFREFFQKPQSKQAATENATSQNEVTEANARLYLWLWAAAVALLFSISSTKLITYILPAMPPLALLIADSLTGKSARFQEKTLRTTCRVTINILVVLGIALFAAFSSSKLLGDKIMPRNEVMPFIAMLALALFGGAFGLWRAQRAAAISDFLKGTASTLVLTSAVLFLTLISFMNRFSKYEDVSPMLIALKPFLRPEDKIVQFKTFQPAAMFYTNAPSTIVDFVNTSGLDEDKFNASPLFPKDHKALERLFQGPHQIYVLVRWKHAHWYSLPKSYVVGRNNDYRLLSNRPAPAGFQYEFVAPKKRERVLSPACRDFKPEC